ncbi:hypothetical protein [Paracidovorax konjaci]|uniref:hypothetical protein n=1 Tax=Paracidovorax konjaci TaxID=32040 RepID=UPI0011140E1F|nr:hypothetical protein [Paracidovorax konjaci]
MNEGIIKRTVDAIKLIREQAKENACEKSLAKIDSFDTRSDIIYQDELIHRTIKQKQREYDHWKNEQGLSDDSREWEFDKQFMKKILEQSSLNVEPVNQDTFVNPAMGSKALGREAADKLYWSEMEALEEMTRERKRREKEGGWSGWDQLREHEIQGRLERRAMLIGCFEYLHNLKNKPLKRGGMQNKK